MKSDAFACCRRLAVLLALAFAGSEASAIDGAWIDGTSLPIEGRGFTDTKNPYDRLPADAEGRVTPAVWELSHHTAGLAFRFTTDSTSIRLKWDLLEPSLDMANMSRCGKSGFDVYRRRPGGPWRFWRALAPTAQTGNVSRVSWRPGDECLINFPLYNGVTAVSLGLDAGTTAVPVRPAAKPIVWYGVSTTQGCSASRPGMSFPAIISRRLGVPHVNLGFSGAGRMEMEMCDYVSRLDASVYVIDTPGNLNVKLMEERYEKFVRELHRRRPDVPIVLAEERVYSSEGDLVTPMDRCLRGIRDRLQAEGGWKLGYVATTEMFPVEADETAVDSPGGHPSDFGLMQLADAYQRAIEKVLPSLDLAGGAM